MRPVRGDYILPLPATPVGTAVLGVQGIAANLRQARKEMDNSSHGVACLCGGFHVLGAERESTSRQELLCYPHIHLPRGLHTLLTKLLHFGKPPLYLGKFTLSGSSDD